MIKRLIQLPRTILSRYRTNRKIKRELRSVKEIRHEQKRIHALFLENERKGHKDEVIKLEIKLEVFNWLMNNNGRRN